MDNKPIKNVGQLKTVALGHVKMNSDSRINIKKQDLMKNNSDQISNIIEILPNIPSIKAKPEKTNQHFRAPELVSIQSSVDNANGKIKLVEHNLEQASEIQKKIPYHQPSVPETSNRDLTKKKLSIIKGALPQTGAVFLDEIAYELLSHEGGISKLIENSPDIAKTVLKNQVFAMIESAIVSKLGDCANNQVQHVWDLMINLASSNYSTAADSALSASLTALSSIYTGGAVGVDVHLFERQYSSINGTRVLSFK